MNYTTHTIQKDVCTRQQSSSLHYISTKRTRVANTQALPVHSDCPKYNWLHREYSNTAGTQWRSQIQRTASRILKHCRYTVTLTPTTDCFIQTRNIHCTMETTNRHRTYSNNVLRPSVTPCDLLIKEWSRAQHKLDHWHNIIYNDRLQWTICDKLQIAFA